MLFQKFLDSLRKLGALKEIDGAGIRFPTAALMARGIMYMDPFGDYKPARKAYMGPQPSVNEYRDDPRFERCHETSFANI
jgi:serine/threonine-protein kinase RIO1